MDWENDSFIMVAQNANDELPFGNEIDVKKISDSIDDTTNTMYADNRYIELTQEQLDAIQEGEWIFVLRLNINISLKIGCI